MGEDEEALARTALLLRLDVFKSDPADDGRIVAGLRDTTARVVADRRNLTSYAGQTALVTLCGQLAMLGIHLDLDIVDVPLVRPQPPLSGGRLEQAITGYLNDLMPGGNLPTGSPDVTFALGDTPAAGADVRILGSGGRAWVGSGAVEGDRWTGDDPVGAMAAAAAAAADGVRAALPHVADQLGVPVPTVPGWSGDLGREVDLQLRHGPSGSGQNLADVDVVSGGAITNAALFTLLRLPDVRAAVRVIEPDTFATSNLNRYALGRRSHVDLGKVDILRMFGNDNITIDGLPHRLDETVAAQLGPLARNVLCGVDHIPSRWVTQRHATGLVVVGSTSHDFVVVSSHPSDGPCAGCTHPRDDDGTNEIPTISFVSFWAGLLQALELVGYAGYPGGSPSRTEQYPLRLDRRRGLWVYPQAPSPDCPVPCSASLAARRRAG